MVFYLFEVGRRLKGKTIFKKSGYKTSENQKFLQKISSRKWWKFWIKGLKDCGLTKQKGRGRERVNWNWNKATTKTLTNQHHQSSQLDSRIVRVRGKYIEEFSFSLLHFVVSSRTRRFAGFPSEKVVSQNIFVKKIRFRKIR